MLPEAEVEEANPVTDEDIKKVRDAAEKAMALRLDVERLGDELERKNAELKTTIEQTLPNAMIGARLETWPVGNGSRFDLTTMIAAGIPKDRAEEAYDWLEKNKHGDLIKRIITIRFGRDDVAWAKKFIADCAKRKKPLDITEAKKVEHQTLGAFVREQIRLATAEGRNADEAAPPDLLGVYRLTFAKFEEPKEKKERRVAAKSS